MDDADRLTPRERYTRRETTRTGRQKNKYTRARARTANARALGLLSVAFTLPMTFPLGFFAAERSRRGRPGRIASIPTSFRARTGRIRGRPEANRRATPGGHRTGTRSASNRARFSRQSIPIGMVDARAHRARHRIARASLARTHRVQIGARGVPARLFRRRLLRRSLRRGLRARHRLLRRRRRLLHRRGLLGRRRLHRESQSGDDRGGAVPSGGSIEGS